MLGPKPSRLERVEQDIRMKQMGDAYVPNVPDWMEDDDDMRAFVVAHEKLLHRVDPHGKGEVSPEWIRIHMLL
eukprot:5862461-Karenia_brevis.AAC.1